MESEKPQSVSRSRLKEKLQAMKDSRKRGGGGAQRAVPPSSSSRSVDKVLAEVPGHVQRIREQIASGAVTPPEDVELSATDIERILAKAGSDPRFAPRVLAAMERVRAGEACLEDAAKTAVEECLTIAQMAR